MAPHDVAGDATTRHWRRVWREKAPEITSWHQDEPEVSLDLLRHAGADPAQPLIDVGGGASRLVDRLLAAGHADLTVLDIAPEALAHARTRLGEAADRVAWIAADITRWRPERRYALWHDRAVFHFLRDAADQRAYRRALEAALEADGQAIIATFALDGPKMCSGLPVERHDAASLVAALGGGFAVIETRHEQHLTPSGSSQSFLWCRLQRS
jgi:SAM-dependent methyltransferase